MRQALLRSSLALALCGVWLSVGQASEPQEPQAAGTPGPAIAVAPQAPAARPAPAPEPRRLPPLSPDDRYELGPGDLLRIRFYEREDLSGDFRVRANGRIGLPMLGVFYVQGKDADELEQEIISAFAAVMARRPHVLIEILERRPFYVTGLVNKPGPYPFIPQMTVLHAMTIAGGLLRASVADTSVSQLVTGQREITRLRQSEASLKRLAARLARLMAERKGASTLDAPKVLVEMAGAAEAAELMSGEIRLFKHRYEALSGRKRRYADSIARIREEIRELEGQMLQTKEQVRLNNLQLDDVNTLREKGLSRRPQVLQLQTLIAGYEARSLEISAAVARANRSLEETERTLESLDIDQKVLVEQEIVETEKQIASTELEIADGRRMVEQITGMPADVAMSSPDAELVYTISRYADDKQLTIDAEETSLLRPGDILRVGMKSRAVRSTTVTSRMQSQVNDAP